MARVIVSAGHSQDEPGAVSGDLKEVDLTHKIAQKVTSKLRANGVITLSVPPEMDLPKRIEWINKTGYSEETDDICIEIHINEGGKSGIEAWYEDEGDNKSQELTEAVVEESCKITGLANQGAKSENDHALKSLELLKKTDATATLVECLYIDNEEDQKFLRDDSKLDLLATGIANGIKRFFGMDTQDQAVPGAMPATAPGGTRPMSPGGFPRPGGYTPPAPAAQPYAPYTPPSYGAGAGMGGFGAGYGAGAAGTAAAPQSREDRKKMIQDKYQKILGRKVNDQDSNYFVNLGLNEDQMVKRIVDSQEHADMVKAYQDYKKIKPEYEKLKTDVQRLEVQVKDKEDLLQKQNELISQKNKTLQALQNGESPPPMQPASTTEAQGQVVGYQDLSSPNRKSFVDKMLQRLNDIFD